MKSCRSEKPITSAAPPEATVETKARLVMAIAASCCALNRAANALVGATAANVAGHLVVDLLDRGMRRLRQQSGRGHDLSGLAVATLRHLFFNPRLLQREFDFLFQSFDGGDLLAFDT